MMRRRVLTVASLVALAAATLAAPAAAHPSFRDADQVPAGSLTTLTLVMAHGCGTEGAGEGAATTDIAVEVHERFLYAEPVEQDGWDVEVETDDTGHPTALVWTATTSTEPAPEVVFEVVVDGRAGDEVYVKVFQACDDFVYRWVGTPTEPADDPAVRLVLADPDPDSPPPPAATPTDPAETVDEDGPEETPDEVDEDEVDDDGADALVVDEEAADDGGVPWLPLVVVALVVVILGTVLALRSRPTGMADGERDAEPPAGA